MAQNSDKERVEINHNTFDASSDEKAKQAFEGGSKSLGPVTTGAKKAVSDIDSDQTTGEESTLLPGGSEIPEWARTGWQRVSNLSATGTDKDIFDEYLGDMYYGQLWLNAAVVFVSVFVTYIITSLGGGIGWVIILSAIVGTYFKNSIQRFYRNARSDISRELAKEKLELNEEPAEWINEFLRRFWLIYEPVLSATIVTTANGVLAASTPSFLDSIRLTTFTLGSKPIIIESVRSYPKSEDDVVVMDWRISFIPNDLVNMTRAQLSRKVNPKIVLTIRLGRGMVGAGIPILLEDMSFSGLIRIKLKLINTFPHVQTVDISFLEEPKLDYVLKPIGGDTFGFDIANLPGLSSFILDQVHATLRPMMYAPNVYTLDAELLMGGYPIDAAIGVLKLTIFSAKGLRNAERFGTSDPYIKLSVHGNKELAKTKVIMDSLNPIWNETHFLILPTLNEFLRFEIWDFNGLSKDKPLGTASYELQTLIENQTQESIVTPVLYEGKPHGEIKFDAVWYPVAEGKDEEPAPESNIGIVRFNLHQAKDLDPVRSLVGQYNPYAELHLNGKVVHRTKTLKRTNNPVWEEPVEIFVTNRTDAKLAIKVRDGRDLASDPIVGKWESTLDKFLADSKEKVDWFKVTEAQSGKLRLTCIWMPVLIDNIPGPAGYVEPCGFVRLHIKNAKELKNVAQIGKSDPYAKIILDSTVRGRTDMIPDTLKPEWDEVFYVPVHNTREMLILQVWDHENNVKDKRLGFAELELSKLIKKRDDGMIESTGSIDTSSPLLLNHDTKGFINYSAAFYPTIKEKKVVPSDDNKEIIQEKESGDINILEHQSGILVVYINGAKFEKKDTCVEVYMDNGQFPVFTTNRRKSLNPEYNEVTDVFVKELDFAVIFFKVKHGDNKNPIGVVESRVRSLLEQCLESSQDVEIPIDGMSNAVINVYVRYVPVKYVVQPSESINNMGILQISVKNAENLPAADRAGTSDPFVIFTLNNDLKVHKTNVVKKNCNPEFNEDFSATVFSRVADVFEVDVFDWNKIENAKKIASGTFKADDLPAFKGVEKKIQLKNETKSSGSGGVLNLHMVFRPSLLTKKKQTTGVVKTLTGGVGNAVTSGVGSVGSGVNTVATGASSVVGSVGSGLGGLFKKPKSKKS